MKQAESDIHLPPTKAQLGSRLSRAVAPGEVCVCGHAKRDHGRVVGCRAMNKESRSGLCECEGFGLTGGWCGQ